MIVVWNTSPLTNLAAIGQFDVLRNLYPEIIIAEAVWDELHAGDSINPGCQETEAASWIRRRSIQSSALVAVLQEHLDRGESETIALAIDLKADLVLLDEREGRRTARRMGLQVMGVLGVLLAAKRAGWIQTLQPQLIALRQRAGFYLSEEVFQKTLELAGELSAD